MPSLLEFRRVRSEEHTSELQSHSHLVCRLLLEKKKLDRKSTRLNSSHTLISYAVFCLKKKNGSRGCVSPGVGVRQPQDRAARGRASRYRRAFLFFNDTAPTEIYTLSLHDALPICLNSSHTLISYAVFCLRDESVTGVQ